MAARDLHEIVRFAARDRGSEAAGRLRERLLGRAGTLASHPLLGRVVPELKAIGVTAYRELIEPPCRLLYRTSGKTVGIVGVLDARRDIEELLLTRAAPGGPA